MNQKLETPRISCGQAAALLILSRLFVLLIFVPENKKTVGGTASLLGVVLGFAVTVFLMAPVYFLLKKYPGMDLYEISCQQSKILGKFTAATFYFVCMAVVVETCAQFTMFLTDAVYPQAGNFWVTLIFCGAIWYLAFLGLEALGRSCAIMIFLSLAVSLLIGLGLWKFFDSLNLITPFYDGFKPVLQGMMHSVSQNTELIALGLLLSNLKPNQVKKTFFRYHIIVTIALLAVGFSAIVVMGHYGQTRNFPIYTMFVLSGSNVFYRLDYLLITIWTAAALMRAALYLILSQRMLDELSGRRLKKSALRISTVIAAGVSLWAAKNLEWFRSIYRFLSSGIPLAALMIFLPLVLLTIFHIRKRGRKHS